VQHQELSSLTTTRVFSIVDEIDYIRKKNNPPNALCNTL